ncbi:hypothetical protein EJ04DRAFT_505781 [Polyplosphaeria fusca]|uniref:Rhodopsin domain-containing protein n=1 Tax=Polyplosphaeria fusca TaxID=682080 RepID=A0A9P4QHG1_9PLEO|nr:hypothetical protein EJ04DRAFT_505781 [Polyplosphaeria fusca]
MAILLRLTDAQACGSLVSPPYLRSANSRQLHYQRWYYLHHHLIHCVLHFAFELYVLWAALESICDGNCLPSGVTAYFSGAINVLTDTFVVLLPLRAITKMNMARSQKVRAIAVFGLGFIVLALSITRLAKTPMIFTEKDPTWALSNFAIYS